MDWISTKDRMPPDGERVLVCLDSDNYPDGRIHIGYRREFAGLDERPLWGVEVFPWDGEGEIWKQSDDEVSCWMPLPEPPQSAPAERGILFCTPDELQEMVEKAYGIESRPCDKENEP